MPLPRRVAYGDIGNESQTHFNFFYLLKFFVCFDILTQKTCFGVTTHSDNLSCVCRYWTMATWWFPSSYMEGKGRRHHGCGCGADAPKHPHKLCMLDTQGTHGASRGLAWGHVEPGGWCTMGMGSIISWCATTIRTPLLLLKLRGLRVFLFVLPCIIFWWLRSPNCVLWRHILDV